MSCNPTQPDGCSNYCSNTLISQFSQSNCWNPSNSLRVLNGKTQSFASQSADSCQTNPFISSGAKQSNTDSSSNGPGKGVGLGILYASLTVSFAFFLNYRNHGGKISFSGMKKWINDKRTGKSKKSNQKAKPLNLDQYEEDVVEMPGKK